MQKTLENQEEVKEKRNDTEGKDGLGGYIPLG